MLQLTADAPISSEPPKIEYATPVIRPRRPMIAVALLLFVGLVLVCVGCFFLFGVIELANHARSGDETVFAAMMGFLSGVSFCGAGVIFYLGTRALLRMTGT
jgi:hypothetical protein